MESKASQVTQLNAIERLFTSYFRNSFIEKLFRLLANHWQVGSASSPCMPGMTGWKPIPLVSDVFVRRVIVLFADAVTRLVTTEINLRICVSLCASITFIIRVADLARDRIAQRKGSEV